MCYKKLKGNFKFNSYLPISNPPNIGEPTKNATVTSEPKTIATINNRLFTLKLKICKIKSN